MLQIYLLLLNTEFQFVQCDCEILGFYTERTVLLKYLKVSKNLTRLDLKIILFGQSK